MSFARLVPRPRPLVSVPYFNATRFSFSPSIHRTRTPFSTSATTKCPSPDPNASAIDLYTAGLAHNKEWASRTAVEKPGLFASLAKGQQPQVLWIGCSDSRVPETTLLGLQPGDVFVHRNIANLLQLGDLSSKAVVEFAVRHLKIKHIVVCGHTSCGGVAAALSGKPLGPISDWLAPLVQICKENESTIKSLSPAQAGEYIEELNVLHGVKVLKQKEAVQEAIKERGLEIHGLYYDVACGLLREIDTEETHESIVARLVGSS